MNIELEVLEQILDEAWPMERALTFIRDYKDPWPVLEGLWRNGMIEFSDAHEMVMKAWEVEALFKTRKTKSEISIRITDKGARAASA